MTRSEIFLTIILMGLIAALIPPLLLWCTLTFVPGWLPNGVSYNVCVYSFMANCVATLLLPKPRKQRSLWVYVLIGAISTLPFALFPNFLLLIPDEATFAFARAMTRNIVLSGVTTAILFWGFTSPLRRANSSVA